jgi:hypothetical protein
MLQRDLVRVIKEKCCKISSYGKRPTDGSSYQSPNGKNYNINEDMIYCPEILFNLALIGISGSECFNSSIFLFSYFIFTGIQDTLLDAIVKSDTDIQSVLSQNIFVTGGRIFFKFSLLVLFFLGSSNIPGFKDRLNEELEKRKKHDINIFNYTEGGQEYLAFRGASILSTTLDQTTWISKQEYHDHGPTIVHKKLY